jgi:hypothetical protein
MDTTTYVLVGLGVALVLAVVGWVYLRTRAPREETFYHFRCPGCRRRLRYRARQVGHAGQCSHCGGKIVFPSLGQSTD